jgi:hypothetical protein
MSMDLYVFVDHPSTLTVIEWQQAIDTAHCPVRLDVRIDLQKASGFFPVTLGHKKTGFYFLNVTGESDIPGAQRVRSTAAYDFNFGGHFLEGASAYYVAAALVASFHGRAFDPQSGQWLDSEELKAAAREMAALGESEPGIPD